MDNPPSPPFVDIMHSRSVVILMVLAVLVTLKLAAPVLVPIAITMFLVALAWPVKTFLNKRLPASLSYVGSFIALIGVLAFFLGALFFSAMEIVDVAPKYQTEISKFWKATKYELATKGVDTSSKVKLEEVRSLAGLVLTNFHETLLALVLIIAYVMLALPEVTQWKTKIRHCLGKDRGDRILSASHQLGKSFQTYLVAMLICGVINASVTYVITMSLGLDLVITWSVLAFFLNFIPVVGAFLTVVPPVVLAFFQFDGMAMPLTVLASLGGAHMLLGNIIEPKIQGNMLSMSPLVVLISLSVWGFLWGIPGALLAAPLTHGILIACSYYEGTRWIACLLSEGSTRKLLRQTAIKSDA